MKNKIFSLLIIIIATSSIVNAQTTQIKISLEEQFFDALLEAVFTHLDAPSVSITGKITDEKRDKGKGVKTETIANSRNSFMQKAVYSQRNLQNFCDESIKLKQEIDGVRTAVKFINGKIYAPIAFLGNYDAPLVGCIEFKGWAETTIELYFDKNKNALVGEAKVNKVNLSGTGGVGSGFLAKFVQNSIDSKVNPIEIINMDKLTFTAPIRNSGKLKMRALGISHKITNKTLDVYIKYRFEKG